MTRQLLALAAVITVLAFPGTASAQKGGGSHRASHASSAPKAGADAKPVHVKTYTKKDGTTVEAHDRKAPTPKGESGPSGATTGATPIRVYRDPVSGLPTFTNAPLPTAPVLASRSLPVATVPAATTRTTPRTHVTSPMRTRITPRARISRPSAPRVAVPNSVARDERGRIQRSAAARHTFARSTGFPNGRPGYVIDHIKPLACGGADAPSNMQWQTIAAAKAKDKVERVGCR